VDVVLDTAEAARVLPQLHQLSAAGLSHPQFDQMPDAVTWWRVRPDAAQLAELARREGRVETDGKLHPWDGALAELAEYLQVMPGRVDVLPDGRQLSVRVSGHPQAVVVTPLQMSIRALQQASMHPCKHVIRPVLWLPADDTVKGLQWDTMTSTDGKLLDEWANSGVLRDRVLPYPAATPEQRQLLVDRAKLLDLHHTAVAPTRMLDVVHGVVTGGRKASDRKLRHQGTAVERLVAGRGKQGGTQVTVKLQDGSQLLLQGGTELLARSEADVAAALMDQATQAFTPDVLRTFTSLCALMDRDGRVRADYVTLAELRGWDPATLDAGSAALKRQDGELVPRARTKRKRLQDAVQTLLDYQFSVTDGRNYVTGPLVVAYLRGGVLANGRAQERRVSVALNPELFTPLVMQGLVAAFDRRLLLLEDGPLRLGIWLVRRMAPSFVTHQLDTGRPQEFKVATMLEGAGLPLWPDMLRKHGPRQARLEIQQHLAQLHDLPDGGPGVWHEYHAADDPAADTVSVWHGTHVVARQLQLKSKSVASRDRKRGKLPGKHA
jgi:hypothetical protein